MKFQFSPGLIGYGVLGTDGFAGLFGQALYFTDRDPLTDSTSIKNAILKNEVLWSSAGPGTTLPGNRKYATNDTFIDFRGFVYKIDLSIYELYIQIENAVLNKSTFFNDTLINTHGFKRWYNKTDSSTRFLIDNNMSLSKTLNYSAYPISIYGIPVKDFARIEHKDSSANLYDGFTLWSSGKTTSEDHQSFGLVRNKTSNQFRIGNLNDINTRNTNIVFDVSLLTTKREAGNLFNKNTSTGAILTNYEIDTNSLFDPNFNISPASFSHEPNGTQLTLKWNLADFTSDTSIKGTLVFEKLQVFGLNSTWNFDASTIRPLVFYDVPVLGSATISLLIIGAEYRYYMIIEKDGWERMSQIIKFTEIGESATMKILSNSNPIALNDGTVVPSIVYLNTTSPTGWNADSPYAWIIIHGGSGPEGNGQFSVSCLPNTGYNTRPGTINVKSEAPTQTINLTQERRPKTTHTVKMITYVSTTSGAVGRVSITPALDTDQLVTLSGILHIKSTARGGSRDLAGTQEISLNLYKNGVSVQTKKATATTHSWNTDTDNVTLDVPFTLTAIANGDIIEVRQGPKFDCVYYNTGAHDGWFGGAGYMQINSVHDDLYWDMFIIDSTNQFWNVERIPCDCPTKCNFKSYTSNTPTLFPI